MSRQRAVRQQLEDLRRAGVTHVSIEVARKLLGTPTPIASTSRPAATVTSATVSSSSSAAPTSRTSVAQPIPTTQGAVARSTTTPAPVTRPTTNPPQTSTPAPVVARPASVPFTRPTIAPISISESSTALASTAADVGSTPLRPGCQLSREERIVQLNDVKARVAQCQRCSELARTRKQTVFGVGNPEASLMFIGEAPGADEDTQGEPFVGDAGKLLNKIISAMKLSRDEVYICNVLRCRPPGNRVPTPIEAKNCREFLEAQITTVNPQWIVCLGAVAAQNLLNTTVAIGKLRGVFHDYKGIKVVCTYHPSYLLRYEPAKKDVWTDMKMLRAAQGVVLQ